MSKKTKKFNRLWMRTGDAFEHEGYDSIAEAATALKGYLVNLDRKVAKGDIHFIRGGLTIKGLFEGHNYISLYWAPVVDGILDVTTMAEENEFEAVLLDKDPVFEQPKGDTPLARAMSIPWVDAGTKPSCVTPRAGYPNPDGWSEQLLVWVKGNGPALGRFVSANSHFVISGYGFGFEVTHWAYITEPKP